MWSSTSRPRVLAPRTIAIIEIGAVRVEKGGITERFSAFVNPRTPIPFEIEKLTGISDEMVMEEPPIEEILPRFLKFWRGAPSWWPTTRASI